MNNTLPANGETGVHFNTTVLAVFSKGMDPGTFTTVSFTLQQGSTPVSGTVALTAATAIFTPTVNLVPSAVYTATISSVVKDVEGNELASNYIWSFTTGAVPDTTPPIVNSTIPANTATNVAVNSAMAAVFNEAMNPLTITPLSFTLKQGTTPVSGTVTYAINIATFAPTIDLAPNIVYTAMISTGAKDLAGNALASNYTWSFTTLAVVNQEGGGTTADTTPPTVSSIIPVNAATGVAVNNAIIAFFSKAMQPLTNVIFTLMQGATTITGSVTNDGLKATFTPAHGLTPNTLYTATITTGAKDLAGNALANNYTWNFQTAPSASYYIINENSSPVFSTLIPDQGYVIKDNIGYKFYYAGNDFASINLATSTDGINWIPYVDNPVLSDGSSIQAEHADVHF